MQRLLLIGMSLLAIPLNAYGREHHPWRIGVNLQLVGAGFDLNSRAVDDQTLRFRPAESNYVGIILGYRWIAGTVAFKVPASEQIRSLEGESRYRDYRLSYFLSNLGAEASYTRYMGYLIDNSSTLSASTLGGQTFYKVPDMETLGWGLNLMWAPWTTDFNLAAALDQSEIQDKSAGAWVAIGTWRYQKITSNAPWIPAEKRASYGADQDIRYAVTNAYGAGMGYAYNWIPMDIFFVSGLFAVSLGYENVKYITAVNEQSKGNVGGNAHVRFVTGVNVEEWILTLGGYLDYWASNTESITIGNTVSGATLTAVVRF